MTDVKMIFHVEKKTQIKMPKEKDVKSGIKILRSYGPSSFASLVDENGNYVQVAGGGVTCMLERRDVREGKHYRAHHENKSEIFKDGTLLVFGGGCVSLMSDEWFVSDKVIEVFLCFLNSKKFPEDIKWRDVTSTISRSE